MLFTTRGIALSYIKFKESSIIARVYTESFGMQSYIVNGIRSKNARTKIALFQPLTLLDLVVYHHEKKDINRIIEIKCSYNFHSIPFDISKTAIALFLTEILNQVLQDERENEQLYSYLNDAIQYFDEVHHHFENFHLSFLVHLSGLLGIFPEEAQKLLKEIGHSKSYDTQFCAQLNWFLNEKFEKPIKLSKATRNDILKVLIDYFRFHFDSIKELKSVAVLKEVLS